MTLVVFEVCFGLRFWHCDQPITAQCHQDPPISKRRTRHPCSHPSKRCPCIRWFQKFDNPRSCAVLCSHLSTRQAPFTLISTCSLDCATSAAKRQSRCLNARPQSISRTNGRPVLGLSTSNVAKWPHSVRSAATSTPKPPFLVPTCAYALKTTERFANRRASTLGRR